MNKQRTVSVAVLATFLALLAVAPLASLAGPTTPPKSPGPAPRPTHTRWEYATLRVVGQNPVVSVNGQSFAGLHEISLGLNLEREARDATEILQGMGFNGWELVTYDEPQISADPFASARVWIFKRPLGG